MNRDVDETDPPVYHQSEETVGVAPAPRMGLGDFTRICGLFFLSRLLIVGAAALSRTVIIPGPYATPARSWLERFTAWDSNWYLTIAIHGYTFDPHGESSVGFYPLYPLAIRALAWCGLDPMVAGYVVSHAALFGSALLIWRLAALETRSANVANLAATFVLLSPGTVWFGMIYAESAFMVTMLGCLLAARQGRWVQAGVWGYASALSRTPGLLLAGFLFLEAAQQCWETRRAVPSPTDAETNAGVGAGTRVSPWSFARLTPMVLGMAGPVLGQLTFLIFLQVAFGDWHAQQKTVTAGWFADGPRWPWTALDVEWHLSEPLFTLLADPVLAGVVVTAVASFWTLRRWGYAALMLALATLYLVSTNGDALLRYLSTEAPMYLVLAQAARRSRLLETTVVCFSVAIFVLVAILLVNGYKIN